MKDAWNLKTDDERPSDSITNFILFCEDDKIEPTYFELMSSSTVKISAIGNCKQHHQQVDFATEYFRSNELLELYEGREKVKISPESQVWCVFDRDKNPTDGKDTAFNDSIANAEAKGIKVAWSNDDFELWLLLHFEDVDLTNPDYAHRSKYYERLTDIFKKIQPINPELEEFTKRPYFGYDPHLKNKRRFLQITYQHLKNKTEIASERAIALEAFHKQTAKPFHLMTPCTMVHKLVDEIIAHGGIKI